MAVLFKRLCVRNTIIHFFLTFVMQSNAAGTTPNINFLRNVVAPVVVPGLDNHQQIRKLSNEELQEERKRLKEKREQRRARAQNEMDSMVQPDKLEPMPKEHIERELGWSKSSGGSMNSESALVDPSKEYDKWAQAYRFLGGYIDCDHAWDNNNHKSGDKNKNNKNQNQNNYCSRWMIYATYVNPNYQGNEYYEYYSKDGSDTPSKLDCHIPDTQWKLLGIFRQEHYQFIEQISKHLWAINEVEYVVALAGLAYMTKYQCYYLADGVYVDVDPVASGDTQVALYSDAQCLAKDQSGATPDDYNRRNDLNLGSKDKEDDNSWAYDYWYAAQEHTLTDMNEVYQRFKYCTTCVDYPTYQDGYFIGDYGTDDDDLINQCWKFWSHDAYICEHDCLSKANAQGTILHIQYGDYSYGSTDSSFYSQANQVSSAAASSSSSGTDTPLARMLANAFLTLTFLLFVATFLAFAVARRSRYRESRSGRSRRLLDEDHASRRSASRRRSKSRGEASTNAGRDGLLRDNATRKSSRSRSTRSSRGASVRRKPHEEED